MMQTIDPKSPTQGRYAFPVKGCMFFGVPHQGASIADKALRFLNVLSLVFNINKNNIQDLKSKSQRFANISSEFRTVQTEQDFQVLSFFETVKYKHHGMVSWSFTLHLREQRRKLLYHMLMLSSTSTKMLLTFATMFGSPYHMLKLVIEICESLVRGTLCTRSLSDGSLT